MNFLGLGPGELFLILVLALIVFGPNKLPEIGASVGKAVREFRKASDQITQELNRELRLDLPPQEPMRTAMAASQPDIRPSSVPSAQPESPAVATATEEPKAEAPTQAVGLAAESHGEGIAGQESETGDQGSRFGDEEPTSSLQPPTPNP